jgi:primosomal protein N''
MIEPSPEHLQERMDKFGFTEQEARISIYLDIAEELLDELMEESDPQSSIARIIWTETHTHEHFNALHRQLALRVLRRNYPEGWGYVPPGDHEEEDQE